jgi:LPXTG-motif cell wall-anchored protein
MSTFWEPTMKKLTSLGALALAALIVAALALLGLSGSAQAYPERSFKLEVSRSVLYGGQHFTATATGNVTCDWTLEWNGDTRQAKRDPNVKFATTYTTPKVTKVTKIPLTGTCLYDSDEHPVDPNARASATPATWENTIIITVLPRSSAVSPPGGSDLPNTGGPNLLFLAGGILLLASGAIAVTVARRRAEEAEIQALRA